MTRLGWLGRNLNVGCARTADRHHRRACPTLIK
jgi:hypothetical protein